MPELTQSRLKELVHYNQDDGVLTWLNRPIGSFITDRAGKTWNSRFAGKAAGSMDAYGYIVIRICGKRRKAHRLAWLYMTGFWPTNVDHDDQVKHHNWWDNLNNGTNQNNSRNCIRSSNNTSGFNGVGWHRLSSKWLARITIDGELKSLGGFDTFFAACMCRHAANIKYKFHPNHGR